MHKIFMSVKGIGIAVLLSIQLPAFSQDLSDNSIKKNISAIQNPLQQVIALQPRTFEYNTGQYRQLNLPNGTQYGFVAEEFRMVLPGLVHRKPYSFMQGKNSYKHASIMTIDTGGLIAVLIAAVQEQQVQINQLKEEVRRLGKSE